MSATLAAVPAWLLALLLGLLGAIWGSFAAALVSRWPRGESVVRGRSTCESCGATLAARDLVPLLSWLALRGRCRTCHAPIGFTLPATEAAALVFGLIPALLLPAKEAIAAALFGWLLLPLILLDFRHLWLPDRLLLLLALVAPPVALLLLSEPGLPDRLIAAVLAFTALEAIRRIFRALRGVDGMGAGDPKLFAAIALWTGWRALPFILLVASIIGLMHALLRGPATHAQFPFGAYLGSAAIMIFWALPHIAV
jgi:leader peptidase (prepilin peptidase) / N-methyltransferase